MCTEQGLHNVLPYESILPVYFCLQYPAACGLAGKVTRVVDLTVGYDSAAPDHKPVS